MKVKKRAISFVLTAMLLMSVGCGKTNTQPEPEMESATEEKETSTEREDTAEAKKEPLTSETGSLMQAQTPEKLPQAAKQRKGTLICGTHDMSGVFHPFYWEANEDHRVATLLTASLSVSDDSGKMTDGTAHLTISKNGMVYTYKISDKDKFSDGSNVTAKDYVNAYKILADPSYDGYLDLSLAHIKGWEDYKTNDKTEIDGVKAVDDHTLQITLDQPNSMAPYDLSVVPVSEKAYGNLLKKGDLSAFKAIDMTKWVGNGAYSLKEYKEKTSATLEANDTFYLGAPKVKKIIFKVVATNAELQALETGDVDLHEDVICDQDHIDAAQMDGFLNLWQQPTLGYGYVGLNHERNFLKEKKVRQALLYALDRKAIVQAVYGDYAEVLNLPQTKTSWVYDDEGCNIYDYDMEKAIKLLKEAGWEKNGDKLEQNGVQMKLIFSAMSDNAVTNAMIPVMIDAYRSLGIDFQAEYVDWPTLQKKSQTGNYDMLFMAWGLTASPDISVAYASKENGGAQNHLGYSNPKLDKLFEQVRLKTDEDNIKADFKKIYKIWNEDLPVFPIYQRSDLICYNTRVKNITMSPYCKWYQQDRVGSVTLEEG